MRKLDINEFKICQTLGRIFEKSITMSHLSSPMFIRRFMTYEGTNGFFDKSYLTVSSNEEDIILDLNQIYEEPKNKTLYTPNQMYWIGYIYGAICFLYELSSKEVYKLFPAKEIVKYYNIYHTFGIEEAAERMMENIGYERKDYTSEGVIIFKKLILLDKLKEIIGQKVHVYIDKSIGTLNKENNIIYKVNCGHIKDFKSVDGNFLKVYVLGLNEKVKEVDGSVYAVIYHVNDTEDKLIITGDNTNYTNKEIRQYIDFIEKQYKYKIIRK